MSEQFRRLLLRIAGGGRGGISEQRLEKWLRRNCGRPVRMDDGRKYQLRGGNDQNERATFRLSKLEDEPALTMTREEWDNVWKEWPHA